MIDERLSAIARERLNRPDVSVARYYNPVMMWEEITLENDKFSMTTRLDGEVVRRGVYPDSWCYSVVDVLCYEFEKQEQEQGITVRRYRSGELR